MAQIGVTQQDFLTTIDELTRENGELRLTRVAAGRRIEELEARIRELEAQPQPDEGGQTNGTGRPRLVSSSAQGEPGHARPDHADGGEGSG